MQHVEYIDAFTDLPGGLPRFSLDKYVMQRDPGETDEEYEARLSLSARDGMPLPFRSGEVDQVPLRQRSQIAPDR